MGKKVHINCEKVLKLMKGKGISMKELATQIGSTKPTLTKWLEKGEQDGMSLIAVIKIGRALDLDWRTLFNE